MALPEGLRVILDTNVVFSGLARGDGAPARTLLAVMPQRMLVSPALLAEYRRVLGQPRALDYLGISADDVRVVIELIAARARLEPGGMGPLCPDPADQHVWDLLAAGPDSVLVTGERKLLASHHFPGRLFSPRDFVDRFLASG